MIRIGPDTDDPTEDGTVGAKARIEKSVELSPVVPVATVTV